MGHPILMGRKTFESIGRTLPGRQNIVLTRSKLSHEGVTVVNSIEEALQVGGNDMCVIGGGQIYEQALPFVDTVHATEVHASFPQATVFFPVLPEGEWREVSREKHDSDERNKYPFDFVVYTRI